MKIAILWQQELSGGVDTHLWSMLKNWPDLSDSFTILYNNGNQGYHRVKKELHSLSNVELIAYQSFSYQPLSNQIKNRAASFFVKLFAYSILPLTVMLMTKKIERLLNKYGEFEAIIANNGGYPAAWDCISAIYAAKKLQLPKRIMLIHHEASNYGLFHKKFEQLVDIKILKSITNIITVSNATRQSLVDKRHFDLKLNPIQVIHNGIDIEYSALDIGQINLREKFDLNDKILIGMVGRIEEYKGHDDLIEACSLISSDYLKKIRIVIVGSGEEHEISRLKKLAAKLGLVENICFTGYLPGSSFSLIRQFDLLASMTKDFEGFGLTIAEAMVVETSVIATNVGAVAEFFDNSLGILVPPKSPKIVAQKINLFIENSEAFEVKRIKAKKIIKKKFNARLMSENFKKIMQ